MSDLRIGYFGIEPESCDCALDVSKDIDNPAHTRRNRSAGEAPSEFQEDA
jgi:hypothetical protein